MSVQDDKETGQEEDQRATDQDSDQQQTEKPEPNEEHKEKAAEMMTAYEDRPTLVLPGSAAMVTGTAVNDWLDDEGNPKCESPDDARSQQAQGDDDRDEKAHQEQIEKDKALNEELKEAAAAENKGEKRPTGS
jgi:hypothetical protein